MKNCYWVRTLCPEPLVCEGWVHSYVLHKLQSRVCFGGQHKKPSLCLRAGRVLRMPLSLGQRQRHWSLEPGDALLWGPSLSSNQNSRLPIHYLSCPALLSRSYGLAYHSCLGHHGLVNSEPRLWAVYQQPEGDSLFF